jgi:hypothetical protein
MTLAEVTLAVVNENQNGGFPLLLVDVDFIYYVNSSGQIYAVPRTGGPMTLLACDSFSPSALAVDDTFLYWGDTNQVSKVLKVPK